MATATLNCIEFEATGMHLFGIESCQTCKPAKKVMKFSGVTFTPASSKKEETKVQVPFTNKIDTAQQGEPQRKNLKPGSQAFKLPVLESKEPKLPGKEEDMTYDDEEDYEPEEEYDEDEEDEEDEEEKIFYLMQQFENCECCEGDIYHCSGNVCDKMGSCFCHAMTKDWGHYPNQIMNSNVIEMIENKGLIIYYPDSKNCPNCLGWVYSPIIKEICSVCIYERCRVSEAFVNNMKEKKIDTLKFIGSRLEIKGDLSSLDKVEIIKNDYEENIKFTYTDKCVCTKQYTRDKPAMEICNCFVNLIKFCEKNCKSCTGCKCPEETKKNEDHCNFCKDKKNKRLNTLSSLLFLNKHFAVEEKCDCCNGFVYSCAINDKSKICVQLDCCHCLKRVELDEY